MAGFRCEGSINGTHYTDCDIVCSSSSAAFTILDDLSSSSWQQCAAYLSRLPATSESYQHFLSINARCMSQYCDLIPADVGGCPFDAAAFASAQLTEYKNEISGYGTMWFFEDICINVVDQVNADIGGIGAMASYVLQGSSALLIWVTLRVSFLLKRRREKRDRELMDSQAKATSPFLAILKSITVEFQEAQCFFMIACQLGVFASFGSLSKYFQATTFEGLENNFLLVKVISTGGVLPTTFISLLLFNIGMDSVYIFSLSAVTVILSAVALAATQRQPLATWARKLSPFTSAKILSECGFSSPPIVYCRQNQFDILSNRSRDADNMVQVMIFCACVQVGLALAQITLHPKIKTIFVLKVPASQSHPIIENTASIRRIPSILKHAAGFLSLCLELAFLYFFGRYFYLIVLVLQKQAVNMDSWSFGQVVSLTLFAPVLYKAVYWLLFGMEGYSAIRIAWPYRIVRDDGSLRRNWYRDSLPRSEVHSQPHTPRRPFQEYHERGEGVRLSSMRRSCYLGTRRSRTSGHS